MQILKDYYLKEVRKLRAKRLNILTLSVYLDFL